MIVNIGNHSLAPFLGGVLLTMMQLKESLAFHVLIEDPQ